MQFVCFFYTFRNRLGVDTVVTWFLSTAGEGMPLHRRSGQDECSLFKVYIWYCCGFEMQQLFQPCTSPMSCGCPVSGKGILILQQNEAVVLIDTPRLLGHPGPFPISAFLSVLSVPGAYIFPGADSWHLGLHLQGLDQRPAKLLHQQQRQGLPWWHWPAEPHWLCSGIRELCRLPWVSCPSPCSESPSVSQATLRIIPQWILRHSCQCSALVQLHPLKGLLIPQLAPSDISSKKPLHDAASLPSL